MNIATRSTTTESASAVRLTLMWFGIQLAWGAVLGISLQARCVQLAGTSSLALFGLTSTLGAIAAGVVQIAAGPLSDMRRRNGDKRIAFYAAGICIASVALIAFYIVPTVPAFVTAFILLQAGMNLAIGPYQAILPDAIEPDRIGSASGWMAAMQSAGNAAGAIAATILGSTLTLGAAIALVLIATAAATIVHLRRIALQPLGALERVRISRQLIDLFISRALVYVGFYTLLGYFFFYVRNALPPRFPLDATTASGIGILAFTLLGALGAAISAKPADRLDERIVVTAGGGIIALSVVALALGTSIGLGITAIAVAGVGWGIFLCADWAYACRLLPPGALATSMAIWNVAVVGPQMIAPAITTVVLLRMNAISTISGPKDAFFLASFEMLAGTLWIWRLPRQARGN